MEGRTLHVRIGDFPATWALSQQTADVVVHGWDVAKATGQQPSADPDVALAVLAIKVCVALAPLVRRAAFAAAKP